ncbi:MAG: gamma-glutamyltransferase family protein [Burkholderiaceae bacterium]
MQMFDWANPYPTIRSPLFARNVVATSHPLAAQAGLSMLARGGNAVDAAVATAAAMTIVEPISNGLGSDLFALVWDPKASDGRNLHGLNASGVAPAAWNVDYFAKKYAGVFPLRGWDTVTVPGAVAGWAALSERFGSLPFADLLAPAIDLAARGYGVSTIVAYKWAMQVPGLQDQPGFAETFAPNGRAPLPGERFVFEAAARTLTAIAESGGASFYRGAIAERMAAHASECGGVMTERDLADYRVDWVAPIEKGYADRDGVEHSLHQIPPNGQGIAALMALGIVGELGISRYPVDSIEAHHLMIEAMKLAFADVYRYVADARHMTDVTVAHLLDDGYLAERARSIDLARASDFTHGVPGKFIRPGGTIYLTTADASGMMVSLIQSNYMGFGSGVVVPGTGVSLQNRGHGFSLDASHPNVVAGGKRPFHTIIPGFLTRSVMAADGTRTQVPQMGFGVMGGNMQPQGHLQTLVRMLTYGQQPQAACDAPRWKVGTGLSVDCEKTMAPDLRAALSARGHRIESIPDPYMDFGSGQFIWKLSDDAEDGYVAASDSRRDGQAVGF